MTVNTDKSKILKQTQKRKEKPEKLEDLNKPNSIETATLDMLQSKIGEQKYWLGFQDIVEGFQNKASLIDYWNKPDKFKIDLLKALSVLETKGKIEKKVVGQESYFSRIY